MNYEHSTLLRYLLLPLLLLLYPIGFVNGITTGSSLIQLYSIPQDLSNVQPGESVIFICTTSGSPILAWSSAHYVSESGLQLFFGADDIPGLLKPSPNNASVANLTMVDGSSIIILESELHIMVLSKYARSTVTCFNNAQRMNASISFDIDLHVQTGSSTDSGSSTAATEVTEISNTTTIETQNQSILTIGAIIGIAMGIIGLLILIVAGVLVTFCIVVKQHHYRKKEKKDLNI